MKKLYKFFFLLFCGFLVVSFVYGTLMSWVTYKVLLYANQPEVTVGPMPFSDFLKTGLFQSVLYSLVLLLMTILLVDRSYRSGQRFTIRNIIRVAALFYGVTTAVYLITYLSFSPAGIFGNILLVLGPQLFLPLQVWYPFLLAWIILTVILVTRIKKTE